jgi:hypothetical protein
MSAIAISSRSDLFSCPGNVGVFVAPEQAGNGRAAGSIAALGRARFVSTVIALTLFCDEALTRQ